MARDLQFQASISTHRYRIRVIRQAAPLRLSLPEAPDQIAQWRYPDKLGRIGVTKLMNLEAPVAPPLSSYLRRGIARQALDIG
ncbi:hypothetical protein J6590_050656 [Homalodisca vitripennis]|nr:hypothetical protein J6590_050656 [Homalodisca vitripennis]